MFKRNFGGTCCYNHAALIQRLPFCPRSTRADVLSMRTGVTLIRKEEVMSSRLWSRAGLDRLIPAGWETWQVGIKAAILTKNQGQQQPCDPHSASHPVLCWVSLHAVLHYSCRQCSGRWRCYSPLMPSSLDLKLQ